MAAIFFLHKGNSDYLKYSLRQTYCQSPDVPIYLLGDQKNDRYSFVSHHLASDYDDHDFEKIYEHLSTNSYEMELLCFKRWFILKNFISRNQIEGPYFYFDSDVLLYVEIQQLLDELAPFEMTVCNGIGPEYSYFREVSALSNLCSFITGYYANQEKLALLRLELLEYQRDSNYCGGGICDMRLIKRYLAESKINYVDLGFTKIGNRLFDDNINDVKGFASSELGIKEIVWNRDIPVRRDAFGELQELSGLHFQGAAAKKLMRRYYRGDKKGQYLLIDVATGFVRSLAIILNLISVRIKRFLKLLLKPFGQ